jgi:hypothetical protein
VRDPQQLYAGLAALVAAGLIVRRTLRPQTIRVYALIAAPVLLFIVACLIVAATPPASPLGVFLLAAGALAGVALGYVRAVHSQVDLGPKPGTIVVAGNGVLVAILLGAFAVRMFGRAMFGNHGALSLAITDAFLLFALASVAVARGMLFFTWRRLTAADRAPTGAS